MVAYSAIPMWMEKRCFLLSAFSWSQSHLPNLTDQHICVEYELFIAIPYFSSCKALQDEGSLELTNAEEH